MAFLEVKNVEIVGVSACVPKQKEDNSQIYHKWGDYDSFIASTGIKSHRVAPSNITTCDLCYESAKKLIAELQWNNDEIEALIFVSQTHDYIMPATSCILQERLGLSQNCFTLDVSLGCSGWVYGLSVITSLMQNGTIKKGLLLVGDTLLKLCSKEDKSTYPLFGDAGSATALSYNKNASPMLFNLHTDGKGSNNIIVKDGGYRNPVSQRSFKSKLISDGISRSNLDMELDGMNVFAFGITKVPKCINELVEHFNLDKEKTDLFVFHQANKFMNEKICKKLKLDKEKTPLSLDDFANTSCASIPLTLVTRCQENLINTSQSLIACGSGVGLSWGGVALKTANICVPDLIEI
ncbi:MAG: ketoacyl-ACP synthase III [Succinivibrio sp.]|nr:ketoacyl-ACP synthase III [Succinivibrio sp.]